MSFTLYASSALLYVLFVGIVLWLNFISNGSSL